MIFLGRFSEDSQISSSFVKIRLVIVRRSMRTNGRTDRHTDMMNIIVDVNYPFLGNSPASEF